MSQSLLARIVWFAFNESQTTLTDIATNTIAPQIKQQIQIEGRNNVTDNIGLTLDAMAHFNYTSTNLVMGMNLATRLIQITQNPAIAAASAIAELRLRGTVSEWTIRYFPKPYLKSLRSEGLTYGRLLEALERGHECEVASSNQDVADKHLVSIETIKQDRKIYLKVKKLADNPPQWLAKILEYDDTE